MKQIALFALFLISGFTLSAQSTPIEIDKEEIQEKMEESFSELQILLDTMDFSQIFNQDFNQLFGENFSGGFQSLDSLGGLDFNELFGEDMFQMFGDVIPQDMEGEDFQKLMEQSMKMLEQIDLSELQGMFEGLNFDFNELENLMPKGNIKEGDDSKDTDDKTKKRKIKKI